jgi:hypothetical protein
MEIFEIPAHTINKLTQNNLEMRKTLIDLWDEMRYNGASSQKSYFILESAIKKIKE